jgi:hypothetical protein
MPRYQDSEQNRDIKIGNRSFENVSQFKYFGTTVTNQNLIQEESKRKLNSAVLSTVHSRTFCLLSKNVKIRIYKNVILPVLPYGCDTRSLISREENRLRIFENRVLRGIF